MTASRIRGARVWGIVASILWCANAQAQSDVAARATGDPVEVRAAAIELHGVSGQSALPGGAVTWTAAAPGQRDFDILTGPLDLGMGAVTGAPYSAEAVNEVVQTLADGNRIVRSSTAAVYRDATGRTRREQGLAIIGPLVAAANEAKQVVITDPEKGVTYMLDPATRTARRLPMPPLGAAWLPGPGGARLPSPPPTGDVLFFEAAVPPPAGAAATKTITARRFGGAPAEASESLGTRTIEGVSAEGTRSTMTIAAGQIGNERPIEIVSERWFSPGLKVLVLSQQSDPRFGETTYRLSNIVLGDPDPALFEVPTDYQVVEAGGAGDVFFRRRVP